MDLGFLTRQAQRDLRRVGPDQPAVSLEDEQTWTYGELHAQANSIAHALLGLGVQPGDRVALLLHNSLDYWAAYFGVTRLCAIAVRLNFRLTTAELQYALEDSETSVLLVDAELVAKVAPTVGKLPTRHYVVRGDRPIPDWATGWDLLRAASRTDPDVARPSHADPAMLMYTSGTTGRPKGAVWTHGNSMWFGAIQALQWKYDASTITLTTGPMYHVGAVEDMSIGALAVGGHAVVLRSGSFDIRRVLHVVRHHRVTDVLLFPYMVSALIDLPDWQRHDLSSVRRVVSGGDPVLPYAIETFQARYPHIEFVQIYGLTEGCPIAACSWPEHARQHPGAVGKPMPFTEISVRDEEGALLPPGAAGEVWTRNPVVVAEYWRKPESSAETFVDGWCRTGDLGTLTDNGLLTISGRSKDMIRSGGENIYPAELEDVLIRHPAVQDAAVIAVPDPTFIETVLAVVVLQPGHELTGAQVVEHVRRHLASYKKPRYVVFVDELPRTPSGKIQKFTLRDAYRDLPERVRPVE